MPELQKKVGAKKKYGEKLKLMNIFESTIACFSFSSAQANIYLITNEIQLAKTTI